MQRYDDDALAQDPHTTEPVAVTHAARPPVAVARRNAAAPLLGLGGLILIVGSLLEWASASDDAGGNASFSFSGYEFTDGRLGIGIGAALLILAAATAGARPAGRWLDANLIASALGAVALAVTAGSWIAAPGNVEIELGLYVAALGAALALAGGVFGIARERAVEDEADPALVRSGTVPGRAPIGP